MSKTLRTQVLEFIERKYGVRGDMPWRDDDESIVVRHPDNRKWFGLITSVPREKLKISGSGNTDIINLKTDPVIIGSFRQQKGILPAWHMNKSAWTTVLLDGTVPMSDIEFLITVSFDLTKNKQRVKK